MTRRIVSVGGAGAVAVLAAASVWLGTGLEVPSAQLESGGVRVEDPSRWMSAGMLVVVVVGLVWGNWRIFRQRRGIGSSDDDHPFGPNARLIAGRWIIETEEGWEQATSAPGQDQEGGPSVPPPSPPPWPRR